MTVTGLENNYYLINNPLNLMIDGFTSDVKYLIIDIVNSTTDKEAQVRIYPINNTFKIDISGLVKSTFNTPSYPDVNININDINISFEAYFEDDTTESINIEIKQFIRGGNFKGFYPDCETIRQNYIFEIIIPYLITKTVPIWGGVIPTVHRLLDPGFLTRTPTLIENFEIPCNGIKVVFLNQYGTYSEWYFNNYEVTDTTKHTDYIEKFTTDFYGNNFNDIGSRVQTTINVKDSVPLRFNELIRHLIISIEIYVIENELFRKVILNNSKWVYSSREKNYKHSITFDYLTEINPTDLC
jgi:hypothetical protein